MRVRKRCHKQPRFLKYAPFVLSFGKIYRKNKQLIFASIFLCRRVLCCFSPFVHPRSPLNSLPRNRFLPRSLRLSSQFLRYTLWLWFSSYTKALRSSKSFFSALYFSQVSWQAWWRDVQLRQQVIILSTPLFGHCFCNARISFTSFFCMATSKLPYSGSFFNWKRHHVFIYIVGFG